jgi:oligogalacturonide lyase
LYGLAGAGLPVGAALREHFPSQAVAYADPATEFAVARLTDPTWTSSLPARPQRALPRNRSFLLYWSDRTGKPEAFRMSLRTGESDQLTDADGLDGSSLWLMGDERSFCYLDRTSLWQTSLSNLRPRQHYRIPDGWEFGRGFSMASDERRAFLVEQQGPRCRLRLLEIGRNGARTLVESGEEIGDTLARPQADSLLYRKGEDAVWLIGYDGRQHRQLKLAAGRVGPVYWSADGSSILYLSFPEDKRALNSIREHMPDSGADRLVAPTSQFAAFAPDGNASVFVGASANKASPHILLLLRATRRELTLCEHRASNPAAVSPVFTADSQQILFQSDQHGKLAIYTMRVDRLVEKTDT